MICFFLCFYFFSSSKNHKTGSEMKRKQMFGLLTWQEISSQTKTLYGEGNVSFLLLQVRERKKRGRRRWQRRQHWKFVNRRSSYRKHCSVKHTHAHMHTFIFRNEIITSFALGNDFITIFFNQWTFDFWFFKAQCINLYSIWHTLFVDIVLEKKIQYNMGNEYSKLQIIYTCMY